jgi:hypothetical protein
LSYLPNKLCGVCFSHGMPFLQEKNDYLHFFF